MLSISCNTFHNIYRIQNCDCISNIQICQIKFCILSEIMFVVVLNILAILSVAIRTNIPIYIFPSHYWNYTRNLIINWNVVFVAQLLDQTEAMANKDLSLKLILQKEAYCFVFYFNWCNIALYHHGSWGQRYDSFKRLKQTNENLMPKKKN